MKFYAQRYIQLPTASPHKVRAPAQQNSACRMQCQFFCYGSTGTRAADFSLRQRVKSRIPRCAKSQLKAFTN